MPINAAKTYAYSGPDQVMVHVKGAELLDRGFWEFGQAYTQGQVVTHAGALYFCLEANTDEVPSGSLDDFWSPMAQIT